MKASSWYLRTQDEIFGPETEAKLIEWARLGRIQPGQEVSDDNIEWRRVEDVPFLDMRFSIDIGDGNPRGPFNRAAAEALLASGRLPRTATMVEVREPFPVEPPEEPSIPADSAEDAPVLRTEERIVEVPVEKIVEKEVVREVRVEVPVEKVVVDETRVKELEELLDEERRHTAELQKRLDEKSRRAVEASMASVEKENALRGEVAAAKERIDGLEASLRDAVDRENKYVDQIRHLEDELRRLPQAASEVADIQVAMHAIMQTEAEELGKILEQEKREFEELKKRHETRANRLQERRREVLKRSGVNIEDMTRKALLERPEDPRTSQLRKELDELRRVHERTTLDDAKKIRMLTEDLAQCRAEAARKEEGLKDVKQLHGEVQELRERLQTREKELMAERQRNEEANQQKALLSRLASLESPSIGTPGSMATNQSRETKQVKLPSWMTLKR